MNSRALEWPSLTTQWLPTIELVSEDYYYQKLLLGTHTSDDVNYLIIAQVEMPENKIDNSYFTVDDTVNETGKIKIIKRFVHPGEVNRARYMPTNENIIATKSPTGVVLIYDINEQPHNNSSNTSAKLILKGHSKDGYGLAWNKESLLASGSDDNLICVWDLNGQQSGKEIEPMHTFEAHSAVVGDVAWHSKFTSIFASVSDDQMLFLWDARTKKPVKAYRAHTGEINSVDFHPESENLLITGSSDKTCVIWDIRNFSRRLHSFDHKDEVFQVKFSPQMPNLIATTGTNYKINIWDLNKVGEEQNAVDAEDGPPELEFIHSGHTGKVSEFSWNPNKKWTLSSVAEDNIVQVWQVVSINLALIFKLFFNEFT